MGRSRWTTRLTVEECYALDIGQLVRAGAFEADPRTLCSSAWNDSAGMPIWSITFRVFPDRTGALAAHFYHSIPSTLSSPAWIQQQIVQITTTKCHFGGLRRWFRCSLIRDILNPINSGKARPESTVTVAKFAEKHWLPWARENCKPSTVAGYETMWNTYLAPHLQKITLRDFRTVDAAKMFAEIHRQKGIGRTTLQHCKSRLSGIFTLARNLGALDSPNPINGAMIPKRAAAPAETYAATPDEVLTILEILRKDGEVKARAAVALMFFAGLRPGEARGARWDDFDDKRLTVRQSVWHKFTTTPKTLNASSPVPVIETLADILAELRQADGNPTSGPILRGPSGKPLLLDNVSKRVVVPALRRCATCNKRESGHKAEHDFKLDESLPTWHGWYSLRRGVATTLAGLTKDGMASKGLLRHTNLATTTRHYVKDVPENTQNAMNLLETLFNECSTTATTRPN